MSEERFDQIDRRFDATDRQFETIGRRFDAIDQRFDAIDHRFDAIDQRFEVMGQRFEAIDGRLDAVDDRFDRLEQRVDGLEVKMDAGFAETRRQTGVLHEEVLDRIAASAGGYSGPTREEFAGLVDMVSRRFDALDAAVRHHTVEIEGIKRRR